MVIILALILLVGFPDGAYAYVDPGTTSSVFGLVATIVSGIGVVGAFLIRPIKRLFHRKKSNDATPPANDDRHSTEAKTPPTPPVV